MMCLLIQVQSILYFAGKFFTTQEARFSYIPSVRSTGLEEKNPSAEMTWPSYYLPTVSNWSTCPFFHPRGSGGNAIELVVMVIKCFSRVFSFFFFSGNKSLDSQKGCLFLCLLEESFSLPQAQALGCTPHPVFSQSFQRGGERDMELES